MSSRLALAEIGHRADRRPTIGMVGREHRRQNDFVHQAVGPVLVALPALVADDVALVVEFFLAHGGQQVAHPVRFHPQGQVEIIRGDGFPVVGAVLVGRAVEFSAGLRGRGRNSCCRDASSLGTSCARRDARSRSGPAARFSSRRDTRRSPSRWASNDLRAKSPAGRWEACISRI